MPTVREPKKANSIEKKKKIIKAGLKIFADKGYHGTNTAEIAAEAGVSTGIVYNYFQNKKDILLNSLSIYFDRLFLPWEAFAKSLEAPLNIKDVLEKLIADDIKVHLDNFKLHEEMLAMSHSDEDVHAMFMINEQKICGTLTAYISKSYPSVLNPFEKAHLVYNLIENLCHEKLYHRHSYLDFNALTGETIFLIEQLLTKSHV